MQIHPAVGKQQKKRNTFFMRINKLVWKKMLCLESFKMILFLYFKVTLSFFLDKCYTNELKCRGKPTWK